MELDDIWRFYLAVLRSTHSKYLNEEIQCFFGYKTDLSYKMDLDLWDCLGRVKLVLKQKYIGLI